MGLDEQLGKSARQCYLFCICVSQCLVNVFSYYVSNLRQIAELYPHPEKERQLSKSRSALPEHIFVPQSITTFLQLAMVFKTYSTVHQ
ncbi:hypothetical protein TNCV_1549651 [Trichonephila clavipes]|nr:hypothetical protein TNCV_1549651 [Trichonephila clavipes]